jgi:excisionase family DNA binding protein
VSPIQAALLRAQGRLVARIATLEERLAAGDDAAWPEYGQLAASLASLVAITAPGAAGELLTTAELAARLQVSPRTLRRRAKAGQLEPVRLGKRGRAALRWPAR